MSHKPLRVTLVQNWLKKAVTRKYPSRQYINLSHLFKEKK